MTLAEKRIFLATSQIPFTRKNVNHGRKDTRPIIGRESLFSSSYSFAIISSGSSCWFGPMTVAAKVYIRFY